MLFVEDLRLGELFGVDPANRPVVDLVAEPAPGVKAHGVSKAGPERYGKHQPPGTHRARGGNGARDEKKRVARQKCHDDAARFTEKDEKHRHVDEPPVVGGKRDEEPIGVGKKLKDEIHGLVDD